MNEDETRKDKAGPVMSERRMEIIRHEARYNRLERRDKWQAQADKTLKQVEAGQERQSKINKDTRRLGHISHQIQARQKRRNVLFFSIVRNKIYVETEK